MDQLFIKNLIRGYESKWVWVKENFENYPPSEEIIWVFGVPWILFLLILFQKSSNIDQHYDKTKKNPPQQDFSCINSLFLLFVFKLITNNL